MKKNYNLNLCKSLTLGIFVLTFAASASAQNRYVATTGTDASNNCTNSATPCLTISHAVSIALDNDTVFVKGGNYTLSTTLGITQEGLVLTALDSVKPVITSQASDVVTVSAKNVTLSKLIFKMGLTNNSGMRGIVGLNNYDSIQVVNSEFVSTKPKTFLSQGFVFGAYAMLFQLPDATSYSVFINNNVIGQQTDQYDAFGRGIGLGFNGANGNAPTGEVSNNDIVANYPFQLIRTDNDILFENNSFIGTVMLGYVSNNATVTFNGNTFDALNDILADKLYTLIDIRGVNTGNVVFTSNTFKNYLNMAIFSNSNKNINVLGNTFTPSATATNFYSIVANTKLMTSGPQTSTYSNEITIKGNQFNGSTANQGTAIVFADHYGVVTPPFDSVEIGGLGSLANVFDVNLKHFIELDSMSGSSDQLTLWHPGGFGSNTPATTMKPFGQTITALAMHNVYGGLTDTMLIESKNIDLLDNAQLGKIIIGYVSQVGLDNNSNSTLSFFPNPVEDQLHFAIEGEGINSVYVVDALGNCVISNVSLIQGTFDVSQLNSGLYFLVANGAQGVSSAKFIKK